MRCELAFKRKLSANGVQGSRAQLTVTAWHLQQRREEICYLTALSSVRRMAAGVRKTAAAAGAERLESGESAGREAELEIFIHCKGWSTVRRASSLVD